MRLEELRALPEKETKVTWLLCVATVDLENGLNIKNFRRIYHPLATLYARFKRIIGGYKMLVPVSLEHLIKPNVDYVVLNRIRIYLEEKKIVQVVPIMIGIVPRLVDDLKPIYGDMYQLIDFEATNRQIGKLTLKSKPHIIRLHNYFLDLYRHGDEQAEIEWVPMEKLN
jgi:hypothetical protein